MAVRPSLVSAVLLVAVLGVSMSGPLVRLADAPALAVAVWRLGFSLVLVALPLLAGGEWRQWRALRAGDAAIAIGAGTMLAFHFWSWNASIGLTTIAASVVLVNLQPLVVAALSAAWLREPPTRGQWTGIAVATAGALVVAAPDLWSGGSVAFRGRALLGDTLAVIGAITAALYYVAGRRLRASMGLWAYVGIVYGACFVVLLLLAGARAEPLWPYGRRELLIFALLAAGPMLLGHTAMNWALRHVRAYQVNVVLLGEPIGATVLAALLPGIRERPSLVTLLGGAIVIAGILLAERTRER